MWILWVIVGFLGITLNGLALSYLWGWFVVPVFHLPALTFVQAIGIQFVVGFMTQPIKADDVDKQRTEQDDVEKLVTTLTLALLRPGFALLFGWILCALMR